jgi:hypothetical protein
MDLRDVELARASCANFVIGDNFIHQIPHNAFHVCRVDVAERIAFPCALWYSPVSVELNEFSWLWCLATQGERFSPCLSCDRCTALEPITAIVLHDVILVGTPRSEIWQLVKNVGAIIETITSFAQILSVVDSVMKLPMIIAALTVACRPDVDGMSRTPFTRRVVVSEGLPPQMDL